MSAGKHQITLIIRAAQSGRGFFVEYRDPDGPLESLNVLRLFEVTFTGTVDTVAMATVIEDGPPERGWIRT